MHCLFSLREVDPNWASWIIENITLGATPRQIHQALSRHGFGEAVPLSALEALCVQPELVKRTESAFDQRLERTLLSRYRLRCLRSDGTIKRVGTLHPNEFSIATIAETSR